MSLTKRGVADQTVGGVSWSGVGPPVSGVPAGLGQTSPVCIFQATARSPTFSGVIWVRGEYFCAFRSPL